MPTHTGAKGTRPGVVPMLHVPDVAAAVAWYSAVGFTLLDKNEDAASVDWALMQFGCSAVMFNAGGRRSPLPRREVDLYITVDNVAEFYERLHGSLNVLQGLHETFYGAREFIVRDLNGFWLTFAEFASPRTGP